MAIMLAGKVATQRRRRLARSAWLQARPARREALVAAGVAAAPLPVVAVEYAVEKVIPQSRLAANLAGAPLRTVVITGANSGVGLAGAKFLTAAGHRVICACRSQQKADAAAAACIEYSKGQAHAGSAVGLVCDLADMASVRAFAASLAAQNEKVDTLVLNAGLSLNATEKGSQFVQRTSDGFERTIGTNHLGHFLLANLLEPALAATSQPRIVITASPVHDPKSGGGDVGPPASLGDLSGLSNPRFEMVDGGSFDPDKAYKDSKLCNLLFMAEAVHRFGPNGIAVNAFSPGLIADPNGFFRNQNPFFANAFNTVSQVVGVAETNEFGGAALAYLAVDADMNGAQGGWYDSYPPGKHQLALHAPSEEARDMDKQRRLWELSAKLTQLI